MDNLKISIKRFFTNKNTVTIFAVLLCLGILYWAYNWRINKATEPTSVPYALRKLQPRTLVTTDYVGVRKVPGSMVTTNVIRNSSDIIGKYVNSNVEIPNGSLFYKGTVVEWDEIPTSLYADIPEGNTIVALPVSMESTYGNSIFPGNYIDLYYVCEKDNKLMLGKFIESIKVLSVTSSDGENIFEKSTKVSSPSYLIFSVPEDMHLLLRKASYLSGTIFPVPRNADYSNNPKETRISSSYIQNYILAQTVNVAEEDLKNIEVTTDGNNVTINNEDGE